jgi:hypothetical protein
VPWHGRAAFADTRWSRFRRAFPARAGCAGNAACGRAVQLGGEAPHGLEQLDLLDPLRMLVAKSVVLKAAPDSPATEQLAELNGRTSAGKPG